MEIIKFTLILAYTLWASTFHAQIEFEKTYGNSQEEHGEGIVQLPDSSYIVVGSTSSFGDLTSDALILKIDSVGTVIWAKNKGGSNVDQLKKVIRTSDGNLAMVGFTNSFGAGGYDVYFMRMDSNGVILQSRTFGGVDWDLGYSLIETSDGGIVISGETYSSGSGQNDAFLLKIDSFGDTIWSQTYGGLGEEIGWSVREASNGDLLLAAETSSIGAGKRDAWLLRLDNLGNIIWEQSYGDTEDDFGADMVELTNGNIMFVWNTTEVSDTNWNVRQSKINPTNGSQIHQLVFFAPYLEQGSRVIAQPGKPATLCIGKIAPNTTGNDMNYFGLDTVGMGYYSPCSGAGQTYGGNGEDGGSDVIVTSDGGFILVGNRQIGTGYNSVFVVKLNPSCVSSGSTIMDSIFATGIDEELIPTLELFPNPSNGVFNINNLYSNAVLTIYNMYGKLVWRKELNNQGSQMLNTGLTAGIYLLKLEAEGIQMNSKIIVTRE
jgi:hypothetical protein